MLIGPPGNGKTSLAEAIATALMVPMIVVRYEGLIGSYLGETAARLAKLVSFVSTRRCVLFLDEFDTLAKERGDIHDTGEIKRVVSSLLLQIDSLPSHVVALTATNHPELLDRAVWRRFQLQIRLDAPTVDQIKQFLSRFEKRFGQTLPVNIPKVAAKLKGVTYADLENFVSDIQRRYILGLPNGDLKSIVSRLLPPMMRRSKHR
jgi:AAA+ superfamily predicted ATPase